MAPENDFLGDPTDPGSGAGNQADDATDPANDDIDDDDLFGGNDDKGKRTTDQVRGEFIRKLDKMQKQHEKQLKELQDAIPKLLSSTLQTFVAERQPQPQNQSSGPKSLSDYTLEELEAGRAGVMRSNDRALIDEYEQVLSRKRAERYVGDEFNKRKQADEVAGLDERTKKLIAETYGAHGIFNEGSEFRTLFNKKLKDLERLGLRSGPADLGAATEAALELGIGFGGKQAPRRPSGGNAANGRTNAPADDPADEKALQAELDQSINEFEKNTGRKFDAAARKDMLNDFKKLRAMKGYIVKGGGL